MIDDLRRYSALAFALCITVLISVFVFIAFLTLDMQRSRGLFATAAASAALHGQARFERLMDHVAFIAVAEISDKSLISTLSNAGLLTLVKTVCERSGGTSHLLHGNSARETCSVNWGNLDKTQMLLEGTDRKVSLHAYYADNDSLSKLSSTSDDASVPRLVLKAQDSGETWLEFLIDTDDFVEGFNPSGYLSDDAGGEYCLSFLASSSSLTLACKGNTSLYQNLSIENEQFDSIAEDVVIEFSARGIVFQLLTRPDARLLSSRLSLAPFLAFLGTFSLCGLICWLVFRTLDKTVSLDKINIEQLAMVERLEQQNQDLDQFATMAAHDLQAPLRFISQNADMLQEEMEGYDAPELLKFTEIIVHQSGRMRELILDLLTFCRAGQNVLTIEPVDILDTIQDVIDVMSEADNEVRSIVSVGDLPSIVKCDRVMFSHTVTHLLGNAVKFSADDGSATVCIEGRRQEDKRCWMFSVSDNGCGIDKQMRKNVFRPFTQLDAKLEGTGVGLAIVRKVVKRHGGVVWIDPDVTVGTTVWFTIPTNLKSGPI